MESLPVDGLPRLYDIHHVLRTALKSGTADRPLRDNVQAAARFVYRNRSALYAADRTSCVKVCAMLSEIGDHFGRFNEAASAVEQSADWFGSLPQDLAGVSDDEFKYVRECIRANVVAAFVRDYRNGDRHLARSRIQHSLRVMNEIARSPGRRMWATRAQANRYLAEIERSDRNYDAARLCIQRALGLYERRFDEERKKPSASQERLSEEVAFLQHRAALCFLSLARIEYLMGVSRAAESAAACQVLLGRGNDPLTTATVSLLRGLILRNRLGRDPDAATLGKADRLISAAMTCFKDMRHAPKLLWATYERAVLLIVARDADRAERHLKRVEQLASRHVTDKDRIGFRARRFTAYCHSRRSRIARELLNRPDLAFRSANTAVDYAVEWSLPRVELDALMTRAAAVLMDDSAQSAAVAERDLRRAFTLDQRGAAHDSRIRAMIAALTARCRIRQGDVFGAEAALRQARAHAQAIGHANVLALVDEVSGDVERGRGNVVLRLDEVATYADAERRLRRYLAKAAMDLKGAPADAARHLHIGVSTLYKWMRM